CTTGLRGVALPVPAERGVVQAGLVAVRTAGEVVVLAEEAERAMAGARGLSVRHVEPRLGSVLAAVARVTGQAHRGDGQHAHGRCSDEVVLHRISFPQS